MDARRRLWTAAAVGFAGVILSIVYLQRRITSASNQILEEETPPGTPVSALPPDNRAFLLQPTPPAAPQLSLQVQPFTNEDLQAFLQEDKKRLGIKKILTKEELRQQARDRRRPPELDPERVKQVEEAREKIREMADELRKANEMRKRQPVVINGDKPALLSRPEDSYAAQGSPTAPPPAAPPETIDSTLAGRPPRLLAGPTQDESRVLRTQDDLDKLWDDMKSSRPKPKVNFDKQMVVAVVADRDSGKGVLIPRIKRSAKKVVVEYRDAFAEEDGSYYEIQIIDRTDDPVVFQKLTALTTPSP